MGNKELCETALTAIEDARAKGWNVLTANIAMSGLSDWHVPIVETVMLDPDPKNGRDVYPQGDRLAVTREGLSKLAVAAGVIWSASETRRTDDRRCRDYVSFQAVGGIQKPDGTYTFMKAEYDLDMEVLEEELMDQYTKKATKMKDKTAEEKAEYIVYCVKRDLIQKRKHKLKLAESGAKDRVIRELLGIKATYTLEQVRKPFVILRITVRPDYSDREVKRAMLAAAIGSMTGIYGGATAQQISYDDPIDVTPEPENTELPTAENTAQPPTDLPPPEQEQAPPFDVQKPGEASGLFDFQCADADNQAKTLESMAKRKGYDLQGYLERSSVIRAQDLKQEIRTKLFVHLERMPDRKEAA